MIISRTVGQQTSRNYAGFHLGMKKSVQSFIIFRTASSDSVFYDSLQQQDIWDKLSGSVILVSGSMILCPVLRYLGL